MKFFYPITNMYLFCFGLFFFLISATPILKSEESNDSKLLDEFISSRGYVDKIIFDASNIKQFWVDKTVFSKDNKINIVLQQDKTKQFISTPLRVLLANVDLTLKCTVDIITEEPSLSFVVVDDNNKILSSPIKKDEFIKYHIVSSAFQLLSTQNYAFHLVFSSSTKDIIPINKIILSFSVDDAFSKAEESIKVSKEDVSLYRASFSDEGDFIVAGKQSNIYMNNNIPIKSNNKLVSSVKIKNVGNAPTEITTAFSVFSEDGVVIDASNYPANANYQLLSVISGEKGSDKIVVDQFVDVAKGAALALNAKADLSDVPNLTLTKGRIVLISKRPDGHVEITLDKPLDDTLNQGMNVRVHGVSGYYINTNKKVLEPGESCVFITEIKKDDSLLRYSSKAFSRGMYYTKPRILSYSVNRENENKVLISDFRVYIIQDK